MCHLQWVFSLFWNIWVSFCWLFTVRFYCSSCDIKIESNIVELPCVNWNDKIHHCRSTGTSLPLYIVSSVIILLQGRISFPCNVSKVTLTVSRSSLLLPAFCNTQSVIARRGGFRHVQHVRPNRGPHKWAVIFFKTTKIINVMIWWRKPFYVVPWAGCLLHENAVGQLGY